MSDLEEGVNEDRKLVFCTSTADWSVPELVGSCPTCDNFLLFCCACNKRRLRRPQSDQSQDKPCHHFRIIFTDGACTNNGRPGAKAGVGVALGLNQDSQFSVPITDSEDNFPLRSNQRAELYAAKLGLEFLAAAPEEPTGKEEALVWIITTDSAYVVKGMTEWLPKWKRNNYRTSKGTKPANLDLFLALDGVVKEHEAKNRKIGFWWIPREYNGIADILANAAAVHGDIASV